MRGFHPSVFPRFVAADEVRGCDSLRCKPVFEGPAALSQPFCAPQWLQALMAQSTSWARPPWPQVRLAPISTSTKLIPSVVSKLFINGVNRGLSKRFIMGSTMALTVLNVSVAVLSNLLKILLWTGS